MKHVEIQCIDFTAVVCRADRRLSKQVSSYNLFVCVQDKIAIGA